MRGITRDGFALERAGETVRPNNRLTVLFTVQDRATSRRGLDKFRAAESIERAVKSKPDSRLGILSVFVSWLNTDTGHSDSIDQLPAALEIRTQGPFRFSDSAKNAIEPAAIRARLQRPAITSPTGWSRGNKSNYACAAAERKTPASPSSAARSIPSNSWSRQPRALSRPAPLRRTNAGRSRAFSRW